MMMWRELDLAQLRARRRCGQAPGMYGAKEVGYTVSADVNGTDQ
jgi:hypothetical protein